MMTVSCGIGINITDPKKETVLIPTDNPYIITARRSHRDLGINVLYGSCVSLTLHMQIIILIKVFIINSMDWYIFQKYWLCRNYLVLSLLTDDNPSSPRWSVLLFCKSVLRLQHEQFNFKISMNIISWGSPLKNVISAAPMFCAYWNSS